MSATKTELETRQGSLLVRIGANGSGIVSGLFLKPRRAIACCVLAHGAGAGMRHPFMEAVAEGLAERRVATLRYQFPYMENGRKVPDRPPVATKTVRAAVATAAQAAKGLPLFAGGKSFGGRMTSHAQAEAALPSVQGLFFLGFPLHPTNIISTKRAEHLSRVFVPMLFLQGTRDTMANMTAIRPVVDDLGGIAALATIEGADHSFHVPKALGRTNEEALTEVLDTLEEWIGVVVARG